MKKLIFTLLLCTQFMSAQDSTYVSSLAGKKNEFRVDLLSLVALSKVNLSYERFLNKDFSVGLSANYSSSKSLNDDFDAGNRNNLPKYEVTPYVRYSISKSLLRYYFLEIFASANGGDFREIVRKVDNTSGYYDIEKSTYFDVAVGGSAGYKMYFKEKFAVEFLVGFGVNTIETEKSPDVFSRVGLSFGYRF